MLNKLTSLFVSKKDTGSIKKKDTGSITVSAGDNYVIVDNIDFTSVTFHKDLEEGGEQLEKKMQEIYDQLEKEWRELEERIFPKEQADE